MDDNKIRNTGRTAYFLNMANIVPDIEPSVFNLISSTTYT